MAHPHKPSEVRQKRASIRRRQHSHQPRQTLQLRTVIHSIYIHNMVTSTMRVVYRTRSSTRTGVRVQPDRTANSLTKKPTRTAGSRKTKKTMSPTINAEATLKTPPFRMGDIVNVARKADGTERLAIVSEMTAFHDDQMAVVCVWLYTRAEIAKDMASRQGISYDAAKKYVQSMWPANEDEANGRPAFEYISSTKRTIAISESCDTSVKVAPSHIAGKLCRDTVYRIDATESQICNVDEMSCCWLKKIL